MRAYVLVFLCVRVCVCVCDGVRVCVAANTESPASAGSVDDCKCVQGYQGLGGPFFFFFLFLLLANAFRGTEALEVSLPLLFPLSFSFIFYCQCLQTYVWADTRAQPRTCTSNPTVIFFLIFTCEAFFRTCAENMSHIRIFIQGREHKQGGLDSDALY